MNLSAAEAAAARGKHQEAFHYRKHGDDFLPKPDTINTGRRAQKEAAALAKKQRKQAMKAAKNGLPPLI